MTISAFDKNSLNELRTDINEALAAVAEKHNIKLTTGNISYSNNTATIKVEAAVKSATGEVVNKELEALKAYGKMYLGQNFDIDKVYPTQQLGDVKFVGLNTRARKNPVLIKQVSTGKTYVIGTDHAERIIKTAA
jgi:hypothetical protein